MSIKILAAVNYSCFQNHRIIHGYKFSAANRNSIAQAGVYDVRSLAAKKRYEREFVLALRTIEIYTTRPIFKLKLVHLFQFFFVKFVHGTWNRLKLQTLHDVATDEQFQEKKISLKWCIISKNKKNST